MKWLILIALLFFMKSISAQISLDAKDSVKETSFVSRLFFLSPVKHSHIVDLEFTEVEFNRGSLGYNYFYSLNNRCRIGGRAGIWFFKSRNDVPPTAAVWGINYTGYALGNISVWKSIQIEFGAGYGSAISRSNKTNTQFEGTKFENGSFLIPTGINLTLWNHLFLRTSVIFDYNSLTKSWLTITTWSLGFKF